MRMHGWHACDRCCALFFRSTHAFALLARMRAPPTPACLPGPPACRVTAVGQGYIDIDRPLPIELRPAWTVGWGGGRLLRWKC